MVETLVTGVGDSKLYCTKVKGMVHFMLQEVLHEAGKYLVCTCQHGSWGHSTASRARRGESSAASWVLFSLLSHRDFVNRHVNKCIDLLATTNQQSRIQIRTRI